MSQTAAFDPDASFLWTVFKYTEKPKDAFDDVTLNALLPFSKNTVLQLNISSWTTWGHRQKLLQNISVERKLNGN